MEGPLGLCALRVCIAVVLIILVVLLALALRHGPGSGERSPPVAGGSRHRAPGQGSGFPPSILRAARAEGSTLDFGLFETKGNVSLYSSLMPWHVPDVDAALRAEFPDAEPRTIIDATAHIGVDAANFLKVFPRARVTAVEIDPDVARILRKNAARAVRRFAQPPGGLEVVEGDSLAYLRGLAERAEAEPADLVFLDPPWGGPGERRPLDLSGAPLPGVVAELLRGARPTARAVLVKLPRWTDLDAFEAAVGRPATRYPVRDHRRRESADVASPPKTSYWLLGFRAEELD
jgi:hypothetical protein